MSSKSTFTLEEKQKFQALKNLQFIPPSEPKVKPQKFECFVCEEETFTSYESLNLHCINDHASSELSGGKICCNICDKNILPSKLVDHLQNLHCKTRVAAKGIVRIPIKKSPIKIDKTY